jgi:Holliday junction DNA helicase RuvA
MIGRLSGLLVEKTPPQILIEAGGVGYELEVPMSTFCALPADGERVVLHTHFVVREDAQLLYGFATLAERRAFREIIRVSGIGAKIGLAVLSGLSVEELAGAIARQDTSRLVKVPGVGKKTADRLLLELNGKLHAAAGPAATTPQDARDDVRQALLALGYHERECDAALKTLAAGLPVGEAIRQALRALSPS